MGAEGLPRLVNLNIAGYPGDQELGEMWYDFCRNVDLPFGTGSRSMVVHSCRTAPGSSGSPMWTYTPEDGRRKIAAVHTSQIVRVNLFTATQTNGPLAAVFLEGDLLQEMRDAIVDMPCEP